MTSLKKRVRRKSTGFVGVNLAKGGDMTLYTRVQQEIDLDPEMNITKLVRVALREYFERHDKN